MIFFRIYESKLGSKLDENLEMIDRCKCEEANANDSGRSGGEEAEEITRENSEVELERELTTTEFSVMDA